MCRHNLDSERRQPEDAAWRLLFFHNSREKKENVRTCCVSQKNIKGALCRQELCLQCHSNPPPWKPHPATIQFATFSTRRTRPDPKRCRQQVEPACVACCACRSVIHLGVFRRNVGAERQRQTGRSSADGSKPDHDPAAVVGNPGILFQSSITSADHWWWIAGGAWSKELGESQSLGFVLQIVTKQCYL